MNSVLSVFIFKLKQLIISLCSSLIAVKQLQYISAWHYTDGNILKYEKNLKLFDFFLLWTCRDLHNAFPNLHAIFPQLHIESFPVTI